MFFECFKTSKGACSDGAAEGTRACSCEGPMWKVRESSKIDQTENSASVKYDVWSNETFTKQMIGWASKWWTELQWMWRESPWKFRQIPGPSLRSNLSLFFMRPNWGSSTCEALNNVIYPCQAEARRKIIVLTFKKAPISCVVVG